MVMLSGDCKPCLTSCLHFLRAGAVTTAADQGLNPVMKAPLATTTSTRKDTIRELTLYVHPQLECFSPKLS